MLAHRFNRQFNPSTATNGCLRLKDNAIKAQWPTYNKNVATTIACAR
jgi:hypothetical protein